jgi:hypothetical protein
LLEHARGELVALDPDTMAVARGASLDDAVSGAGAVAVLANMLLIPLKLGGAPVVEVPQRDGNFKVGILAASLLLAEVATSAEETVEDVEGIVVSAAATLLLVLL